MVREWSNDAPDQALAWVRGQKDERLRGAALQGTIDALANRNPQMAAALFAELPATHQNETAISISSSWVEKDPDAASRWALSLPDGPARENAVGSVVSQWTQNDPAAAGGWVQQLPAGTMRDAAVGQFANQVVERDPARAMEWVRMIADPAVRSERLENVARRWLDADPGAAKQWLRTTNQLSAEAKQDLLEEQ